MTPKFETEDGDVLVTFTINEGLRTSLRRSAWKGTAPYRWNLAPDGLRHGPRQPPKSIDDDRNKIMSYYLDHGYLTSSFNATAAVAERAHKLKSFTRSTKGAGETSFVTIGHVIRSQRSPADVDWESAWPLAARHSRPGKPAVFERTLRLG